MTPGTQGDGARCAQHPAAQGHFTCQRCGSFMCDVCAVGGSETLCPACRQRTGVGAFPFHRDNFSFDKLWNFSFEAWKKQWVLLSVAVLALGGIYVAGAMVMQVVLGIGGAGLTSRGGQPELGAGFALVMVVVFIGYLGLLMTMGVAFIGFLRMCSDALLGKQVDFGVLFSQFPKLGRALGLLVMMMGIVMIPVVVFGGVVGVVAAVAIPAVTRGGGDGRELLAGGMFMLLMVGYGVLVAAIMWISLPFTFALLELAHTEVGAVECLRRGYALSKGYRLQIFAYRLLGGLLVSFGMMLCCLPGLPAAGLAYMLESSLYFAVRNGSGLPPLDA
jgi:hypothetical protein